MARVIRSLLRVLPILATSITIVNAEDFAEWIPAPDNSNLLTVTFNETELFRVLDHQINKRSPAMLEDRALNPPPRENPPPGEDPWPNGRCPQGVPLYHDSDEDQVCDARFARHKDKTPDGSILFASYTSICSGAFRKITCKLCFGYGVENPHDDRITTMFCGANKWCAQDESRWNKWGVMTPHTMCVPANTLTQKVISSGSAIKEYCTTKVRYPGAGKGKKVKKVIKGKVVEEVEGRPAKFHAWFYDTDTGFYTTAKWLYLKVNDGYARSAFYSDDWTTTYPIFSTSNIEMCAYPLSNLRNLELQFQATMLDFPIE